MSDPSYSRISRDVDRERLIDALCDRFEKAYLEAERPRIEDYLVKADGPTQQPLLVELIALELYYRRRMGESPAMSEYQLRFPGISEEKLFVSQDKSLHDGIGPLARPTGVEVPTLSEDESVPQRPVSTESPRSFGDYEILETIARGGMGVVYKARQKSLDRIVALKMILAGEFASQQEVDRFCSEAKAAAMLEHPGIVPIFDIGENEGMHFFTMAYVEGPSLAARLHEGPMEPKQAARIVADVTDAVQYAHEHGVIHRDLKPANILLDKRFKPRVTDFGLAKRASGKESITQTGEVLGTASYMPPEQAAGRIDAIGPTSDVYALGAVLYSLIAGRPPFQAASTVGTLLQVIEQEPVAPRQLNASIPLDLETIILKCLEKSLPRRYATAKQLGEELHRFIAGEPILARPVSRLEKIVRWCRRNPSKVLNIAGIALFALAAIVAWGFLRVREREVSLQEQAAALAGQLNVADESRLSTLLEQISKFTRTKPLLQSQFDSSPIGSRERYRAALGLLPGTDAVLREICHAWLDSNWSEWILIRDQLAPQMDSVSVWLQEWDAARVAELEDAQFVRFAAIRAAAMGDAAHVSFGFSDNDAERMVTAVMLELLRDPSQLMSCARALAPLRRELETPLTFRTHYSRKELVPEASVASRLMAEFFWNEAGKLIAIGGVSKSEWIPILFGNTRGDTTFRDRLIDRLQSPIQYKDWEIRIIDCRKHAIAAAMLYKLGESELVWPLLYHRENTTVRSLIIDWIPVIQRDPRILIQKARSLIDDRPRHIQSVIKSGNSSKTPNLWLFDDKSSLLRAVLTTLGNYPSRVVQRSVDESFWKKLAEQYEFDPDPGLHSVCEWLFRVLDRKASLEPIDARLQELKADRLGWRVIANGHTLATLHGPLEYEAGSDPLDPFRLAGEFIDPYSGVKESWSEDDLHTATIPRSFMIALHETRLSQMHHFDPDFHSLHNKALGPSTEHPACRVSWQKAASYCNWLSQKEGISEDQWCFVPSEDGGLRLAADYLDRNGYRLPSEAEWEYACRAGTSTRTYLGDSEELLLNNVWFVENSKEKILSVPGMLKGNGLGMFDTLGNVIEWCMDGFDNRDPRSRLRSLDVVTPLDLNMEMNRICRGSSLYSMAYSLRAADYGNFPSTYREGNTGFRIARTLAK
ncbi:MAG: protein kinase [Planctomycetes bacterium]|nr:protein kinase [Planctomycetota bacterium]